MTTSTIADLPGINLTREEIARPVNQTPEVVRTHEGLETLIRSSQFPLPVQEGIASVEDLVRQADLLDTEDPAGQVAAAQGVLNQTQVEARQYLVKNLRRVDGEWTWVTVETHTNRETARGARDSRRRAGGVWEAVESITVVQERLCVI